MREYERKVISIGEICEKSKMSDLSTIKGCSVVGFICFAIAAVLFWIGLSFALKASVGFAVLFFSVCAIFLLLMAIAVQLLILSVQSYKSTNENSYYVAEAVVSEKSERWEKPTCRSRTAYMNEPKLRHYMTFKGYGEVSCSQFVKEGDKYYLLMYKKTNAIIAAYSVAEYRFRG